MESQEVTCIIHWYRGWTEAQRKEFLRVLENTQHEGVNTVLDLLESLTIEQQMCSVFECQLRLFRKWYKNWGTQEKELLSSNILIIDSMLC